MYLFFGTRSVKLLLLHPKCSKNAANRTRLWSDFVASCDCAVDEYLWSILLRNSYSILAHFEVGFCSHMWYAQQYSVPKHHLQVAKEVLAYQYAASVGLSKIPSICK